jgi:hypothetical protein
LNAAAAFAKEFLRAFNDAEGRPSIPNGKKSTANGRQWTLIPEEDLGSGSPISVHWRPFAVPFSSNRKIRFWFSARDPTDLAA